MNTGREGSSRFVLALVLVTLTGYLSLSYEILWVRLYNFTSGSRAWAFGALLGSYLIGLALGSLWSMRHHGAAQDASSLRTLARFVLLANLIGFLVAPVVSLLVLRIHFAATLPLIILAAAFLGAALPLICHFAIPPDARAGARLSYLYLGNILGSGAGSLFSGFILMDRFSFAHSSVLLAVLGLLLAAGVAWFAGARGAALGRWLTGTTLASVAVLLAGPYLFNGFYERLQLKRDYQGERFQMVVESRFGVITVDEEDRIYGGGMYDGYLGTELRPGSWMVRPYFLSAVHENPREILVIGLSGGTWTQILAHHPQVEHITAVEINAAYSERVIPRIKSTRGILQNPKVEVVVDDGRRWLRRNPDRKFDAIIANTTHHWREHATNLLSREFMELVKDHLKPGGIYQFNATGSYRAERTAATVFPDAVLLLNNIVASNGPIQFDRERWRRTLDAYSIEGTPVFEGPERDSKIDEVVSLLNNYENPEVEKAVSLLSKRQILENSEGYRLLTDNNLGHEFWWD